LDQEVLTIIGPVPEPKGGVGVHILRLSEILKSQYKIRFIDESPIIKPGIFNVRSKKIFTYMKLVFNSDVIHIHSGILLLRVFHIIISKLLLRKRTIVTIHSLSNRSGFNIWINAGLLRFVDKVITVNPGIRQVLNLQNALVKPAFIPPDILSEPELPEFVKIWVENQKKNNRKIICANAFRIDKHEGVDLYGIDMCLHSMRALVNDSNIPVSLIFVVASLAKCGDTFKMYQQLISDWGLNDYVMLVNTELSFVKLIECSDIVVRPTNTDGDALTIREALYLNKPVIASDVVQRPDGTVIFATRNNEAFTKAIISTLSSNESQCKDEDSTTQYVEFYKSLYAS